LRYRFRVPSARPPALRASSALTLAACLAAAPAARASAFEVHGLGPAGVAEVGARAARADDGSSAFYNPGGLAFGRGARVDLAPTLGVSALAAQGRTLPLALGRHAELVGRAGAGYEPSILTGARQGRTNLVDGHKALAGLGATLRLGGVLGQRSGSARA